MHSLRAWLRTLGLATAFGLTFALYPASAQMVLTYYVYSRVVIPLMDLKGHQYKSRVGIEQQSQAKFPPSLAAPLTTDWGLHARHLGGTSAYSCAVDLSLCVVLYAGPRRISSPHFGL